MLLALESEHLAVLERRCVVIRGNSIIELEADVAGAATVALTGARESLELARSSSEAWQMPFVVLLMMKYCWIEIT